MTSYGVIKLRLDDLESAVITCERCKAQVSLLLGTRGQVPELCPSCRTAFDDTLRRKLLELLEFYVRLGKREEYPPIEIQIRPETDKEKAS